MTTTTPNADHLTDIGPAIAPPSWCLPGTRPDTDSAYSDDTFWSWVRTISPDVWIACEDTVIDGRIMRSLPAVYYSEPSRDGATVEQVRELAAALVEAADIAASGIITCNPEGRR